MAVETVDSSAALDSANVGIYRTATVVKGGRRFSWSAMIVVGDHNGSVGIGYGKATSVPAAIEKAQKVAKRKMVKVTLKGGTLPHEVLGKFGASSVKLIPAAPGTGVIAGATVRAVLEMAGVRDCLTKAFGSTNQKNLCKAAMEGLKALRSKEQIAQLRGVEIQASAVEEMLEAGQRYAPTVTTVAPKAKAAGKPKKGDGKGKQPKTKGTKPGATEDPGHVEVKDQQATATATGSQETAPVPSGGAVPNETDAPPTAAETSESPKAQDAPDASSTPHTTGQEESKS